MSKEVYSHYGEENLRITLNAIALAQVRLINTVHFRELDALFFKHSGRLLIVRSERFAVPTPL